VTHGHVAAWNALTDRAFRAIAQDRGQDVKASGFAQSREDVRGIASQMSILMGHKGLYQLDCASVSRGDRAFGNFELLPEVLGPMKLCQ
jgi:hypothetical protein